MKPQILGKTATFAALATIVFLVVLGGCKRKSVVLTVTRPVEPDGLAPQTGPDPNAVPSTDDLESIRGLGDGVGFRTPDGEGWSKYACGIMIHDLKPGTPGAEPRLGQTVKITYVGTFPGSDKQFGSQSKDDPLSFRLGSKSVIKGLNYAVATMPIGRLRRMYIPAELAYGKQGKPPLIGPDQPLIFEIELLSVTGDAVYLPPASQPDTKPEPFGPPAPATLPATAP